MFFIVTTMKTSNVTTETSFVNASLHVTCVPGEGNKDGFHVLAVAAARMLEAATVMSHG
jgi:hypothetical protein